LPTFGLTIKCTFRWTNLVAHFFGAHLKRTFFRIPLMLPSSVAVKLYACVAVDTYATAKCGCVCVCAGVSVSVLVALEKKAIVVVGRTYFALFSGWHNCAFHFFAGWHTFHKEESKKKRTAMIWEGTQTND